ncbi:hypothetical protein JCGZ_25955 [Jatropha curcas]|uniref:Uncharacterized protein n=1 Tax=Jatropha curcas TaxID=180498 RepID=A0A067JRH2_JATCU|nr:hypothetical protein JCGZ_25955 [Jatropha curcas]
MPYFPRRQHHQQQQREKNNTRPIPAWEKQFCFAVGGIRWQDFLRAKKYASEFTKIMEWDDSAGKESFYNAKSRFWAKNGGLPFKTPLPSPDIYIDRIDWTAKLDSQLLLDLEKARIYQVRDYEKETEKDRVLLKDIKPTGWDIDFQDWNKPVLLIGMIVGDKGTSDGDYLPRNYKSIENYYQGENGSSTSGHLNSRRQGYKARVTRA